MAMEESGNVVRLPLLIDYMVQKTYHDLIVLSELLPRKSDTERKTSIYQFSNRTYQQFFRLRCLVEWACKASTVEKCGEIIMFLDKQASLFVETADSLFAISKERLKNASFPVFALPTAVDVMVTGSYPRLPQCIKDKIIRNDTLTDEEREETLTKLTSLIQQRLVLTKIPHKFKEIELDQGFVKLTVPHEFSVRLTVPNDDFKNPWSLLSLDLLVQNPLDDDPRPAVHPQQRVYITELLQSRLFDPDTEPLESLCETAHQFCLLLQLSILEQQAKKMRSTSWHNKLRIVDYMEGNRINVQYWLNPNLNCQNAMLIIYLPEGGPLESLKIDHRPNITQIPGREPVSLDLSRLSLERILIETIEHRSYELLSKLRDRLNRENNVQVVSLSYELLLARLHEKIELRFHVDHYTGHIICTCNYSVTHGELNKAVLEIHKPLTEALHKVRMRVDLLLIKNALLVHNIKHQLSLQLTPHVPPPKQLQKVSALYVKYNHSDYVLAIDLQNVKLRYLLLRLEPAFTTADGKHAVLNRVTSCTEVKDIPVLSLVDLDSMEPVDVILKIEKAIVYINLEQEWKKKGQKCLGIVPQAGNWCLKLLTLPTNHPVLKQLLKDLSVYVYNVSPPVIKYFIEFDTKHELLPANTFGVVQAFYTSGIKMVVDNFSIKWREIHYLFTLLYSFQCLRNESLGRIKKYNFHNITLSYTIGGVEHECFLNLRNHKYRLVFYQSRSGRTNTHAIIRSHLEQELATHQSIFKLLYTLHRTANMTSLVYGLPKLSYWGLDRPTSCNTLWQFVTRSPNAIRVFYRGCVALDIICYTADSFAIRDVSAVVTSRLARYTPVHLLHKLMEIIAKKVAGASVDVLVSTAPSQDQSQSKFTGSTSQPATPGFSGNQPTTPGYPPTPNYANPTTPGYPVPSPVGAKNAQPSPQQASHSPFVQPNPSPMATNMGAPSPMVMLMSPQTTGQYMPNSPAPVPSPSGYMQQPSPSAPMLGSPTYCRSTGTSQYPSGTGGRASTLSRSSTLYVNRIMLESLMSYTFNPLTIDSPGHTKHLSALENMLAANHLKRYIASIVGDKSKDKDKALSIRSNELLCTSLHHETCFYRFSIEPSTLQSISLTVTPTKEGFWNKAMTDTLSNYFSEKIAVHPFKINVVSSFIKVLGSPKEILQQFVNIMAFELRPDMRLPWRVSWLPMVPPEVHHEVMDNGHSGYVLSKNKILFFIRLEHAERPNDPVTIPMVYEQTTGITKSPEQLMPNNAMTQRIGEHFKLVNTLYIEHGNPQGPGSISACILDLLKKLSPTLAPHTK